MSSVLHKFLHTDAISNAVGYAKFFSRSHDAVIRVYDDAGNVIDETHEHAGKPQAALFTSIKGSSGQNDSTRQTGPPTPSLSLILPSATQPAASPETQ